MREYGVSHIREAATRLRFAITKSRLGHLPHGGRLRSIQPCGVAVGDDQCVVPPFALSVTLRVPPLPTGEATLYPTLWQRRRGRVSRPAKNGASGTSPPTISIQSWCNTVGARFPRPRDGKPDPYNLYPPSVQDGRPAPYGCYPIFVVLHELLGGVMSNMYRKPYIYFIYITIDLFGTI